MLALGAETYPGGDPAVFNMAVMGMRLAQRVNGVSRLHGRVSRAMFSGLWPGFDPGEVPIGSITNGVHTATWVAPEILALAAGDGPGSGLDLPEDGEAWDKVAATGPARIWEIRRLLRERLVEAARQRLRASWRQRGASDAELDWTQGVLEPGVLTVGLARRVPSYKQLMLMLHDPDLLGPAVQRLQVVDQLVGVVGDAHRPLVQLALLDDGAGAPAAAVLDLLVGQHGLVDRVPVDQALLAIDQAAFVEV